MKKRRLTRLADVKAANQFKKKICLASEKPTREPIRVARPHSDSDARLRIEAALKRTGHL